LNRIADDWPGRAPDAASGARRGATIASPTASLTATVL
jgi:hypothetical protein